MKMIIDIPDNELKDPLKNIHLFISNKIVTEVCIKTYDKDKPYFMNLNYALLEESEDCVRRSDAENACLNGWNKDYKEILTDIRALPPVKPIEKVGHWISNAEDDLKISEYTCSNCKGLSDEDSDFCPKCGSRMI